MIIVQPNTIQITVMEDGPQIDLVFPGPQGPAGTGGGGGGSGDVVGPSSATDNAVARFDGTTGKLVQNSAVTIADATGDITGGKFNGVAISGSSTPTLAVTGTASISGSHSGTSSGTNTGDQTSVTGNAGTATALQTARTINGVSFDGTANITVAAAAGTLTGTTLAAGVTGSSLTSAAGGSFGTLAFQSGTFSGTSSGTNTGDQTITLTGNVTGSGTGSFAATIANSAVTYAKIQNVSATDKILGRSTAGAGVVEEIACTAAGRALLDDVDASAQRTTLGLGTLATQSGTFSGTSSGTNTGDQTITLTGDVTGSGTGSFASTIANSAVTLSKFQNISTASFLGRSTAGSGAPEILSSGVATQLINVMVGDSGSGGTKGLVGAPSAGDASAGKFWKADGTWAVPSGGGGGSVATDTIWDASGDLVVGTGANTAARLAPPTKLAGQYLYYGPAGVEWVHPSTHYIYRQDFLINFIPYDWTALSSSGIQNGVVSESGAVGILYLGTGTAINTYRHHYLGPNNQFALGCGRTVIEHRIRIPTESTGSETFTVFVGLYDHQTTPVDGAWFEYSSAANSGNWQCKVANNSSTTTTANTSVAWNSGWNIFTIDVNSTATEVKFYINGTLVGTETGANIPGVSRQSNICHGIVKNVGSGQRFIHVDYVDVYVKY